MKNKKRNAMDLSKIMISCREFSLNKEVARKTCSSVTVTTDCECAAMSPLSELTSFQFGIYALHSLSLTVEQFRRIFAYAILIFKLDWIV